MLRENIDGETLEWAATRLRSRPEWRRLLVVLSDGAPVDDSTLMENGPQFLELDVLRVIGGIEASGNIALGAVGPGHSVERYYAHSRAATDFESLPAALVDLIGELVGGTSP